MLRILLSIVIIFFAVNFFVFSEEAIEQNHYLNGIASFISKIQTHSDEKIKINNEDKEQVIEKSQQPLQGYGISPEGVVTLDDEYFGYLYYEIEKNSRLYAGREVIVTGFVFKESDFKDNEIKVARIQLPKCGSEEEQVLGLMCITEKASDFNNDEWVTVKGTLIVKSYINPRTNSESYKYYLEPESIEKIQRDSDYTI